MEHRILVGTGAFLAIMVLVGWIAINEGGRMQAFQRQYEARAIERGAELFTANCTSCHGPNGYGLTGIAPALNSPQLFGHDFLAISNREIEALTIEVAGGAVTPERQVEIDARLVAIQTERAALMAPMQAAVDKGYNPEEPSRLRKLNWNSTLHNFIYTTLVHGRPTSGSYWPNLMAAWAQSGGGSLRSDQVEDLTTFILNWDRGSEWTVDDLLTVEQFPRLPVDNALVLDLQAQIAEGGGGVPRVGVETPIEAIMVGLVDVAGDPVAGQALYNGALACAGCHMNGAVAPTTEGTFTRVNEVRLLDPQFANYTAQMYLAESIIHPNDYVSPGYGANLMPANFGERLTYQNLADLIAYTSTQDQPVD